MSSLLNEIRKTSQTNIENAVGKSTWKSLDSTIKTGVLTSEIFLRTLSELSSTADYSASIMPIMKVLENELINHFYVPYYNFIKKNYTPEQYIVANKLDQHIGNPDCLRRKILYYNKNNEEYVFSRIKNKDNKIEFTIGNYQFTVGAENYSKNECDSTAIRFYKECVFNISEKIRQQSIQK